VTFEEEHDLLDVVPIAGLVDGLDAGSLAALDVVEQAGPVEGASALANLDVQVRKGRCAG